MFNVHGWAYSSPYYIPSAWASALLILYQGQCESLMSGISKVADSRALFICSPQHNYHSNAKGIALGRSCARHGLGYIFMKRPYLWKYSFPMKKGIFDNEYYFYEDGNIIHFYDRNQNKFNIEEIVSPSSISEEEKLIMLESCPDDLKETIKHMLQL